MEDNNNGYGCLYKIMFVIGLFGVIGMLFAAMSAQGL
jgi:hypothetical protein